MNKTYRPKRRIKIDQNHFIVPNAMRDRCAGFERDDYGVCFAYLRGLRIAAYDTSKFGGEMLDWLVMVGWLALFFEVKRNGHEKELKPGENAFLSTSPGLSFIVSDQNEVYDILLRATRFIMHTEFMHDTQKSPSYRAIFFPKMEKCEEENGN
jgi:hypothetical protein